MVGVNMMPADHDRLVRLAELWGQSKAATIRRLIQEATVAFDDRDGHTCPEGVFAQFGTSNPEHKGGRCVVCWPEPPTRSEQEYGRREAQFQATAFRLGDHYPRSVPWWVHVDVDRRKRRKLAAVAVDETTEALQRIANAEATWEEEERAKPPHRRICTARTKKGSRCSRLVGRTGDRSITTCKQHRR